MLATLDVVFRLRTWAIYRRKGKFFVSTEDHPKNLGKPYKSLRHACTAIARKMEIEWNERIQRYGGRS